MNWIKQIFHRNPLPVPPKSMLKFKNPIDICAIPEVYEAMIDYRNEHSKNQQRQLAVSCRVIKTILSACLEVEDARSSTYLEI